MPNPENIEPHKFKPGTSGNPAGRPVGARSLSTILKEMLEEEVPVNIDGQPATKKQMKEIIIRKLLKGASDGDTKAINTIFDRTEGKAPQHLELSTPPGRPFESTATHEVIFRDFSKPAKATRKKKPKH